MLGLPPTLLTPLVMKPERPGRPNLPMFIDPVEDLKPQAGAAANSWFISSNLHAREREFGLILHYLKRIGGGGSTLAITDVTNQRFLTDDAGTGRVTALPGGFEITAPNMHWTGTANQMRVTGTMTTGQGSVDLTMRPTGKILAYNATGFYPLIDNTVTTYQYAFPEMTTEGTITLDGQALTVTGNSWFDRQWFRLKRIADARTISSGSAHWTWMAIPLSNGHTLGLWSSKDARAHDWVTILHSDGSHTVADIAPLADNQHDTWVSKHSGVRWPNRWELHIPAVQAHLTVSGAFKGQEALSGYPRLEAVIHADGTFEGEPVTGTGFCEIVNDPKIGQPTTWSPTSPARRVLRFRGRAG